MNTKEIHNVVKSAKSKLLQEQKDNNTASYSDNLYGSLEELREAYDLSSLSTEEIKELIQTFV